VSSHEALRKRVETILDMASSTVSSLSESFMSGVPVGNEDGVLSKDKPKVPQEINKAATVGSVTLRNGHRSVESKDEEESSELTEQSDDDGRMLEVHD